MTVPSNEVMFQSVVDPATGVALTGLAGSGRLHEVESAEAAVVVVDDADDEHPARVATTTRASSTAAATGRRCRDGCSVAEGCIGGVLHRGAVAAIHRRLRGHRAGFDGWRLDLWNGCMVLADSAASISAPRSDRRRWWALVVVCLAMFMNALDSSIVNVALPAIQKDLHFSASSLTWVVTAFLITFGSFLLMAGRLGDLIGRRKVFLCGIVLFTSASVMCGVAQTQAVLIAGRFIQGIGGAFSASVIIAIIVTEFPAAAERSRAMSAYIFVAVGGGSIGLLVGGVLTQALSWHWIFFINVPIGVFTFLAGRTLIVENVGLGIRTGVDVTGSVLVTLSLMLGIYAISTATEYRWLSLHTLGFGGASAALLVAFFVLESRLANPIMPLRILRIRTLTRSSIIRGMLATGMFTTFFLGALYLEGVLGFTPVQTGVAFLPMSISMGILSAGVTARLVTRFGDKRVLIPGMVSGTLGLLLLTTLGTDTSYAAVMLPAFLLIGLGAGTAFAPLLSIAMADVPVADAGLGSGIVNVSMQMASALGLAVLSAIATGRTHQLESAGQATVVALTDGYRLAFLISAVLVGLGTVVAVVALDKSPARPGGTAEEVHLAEEELSAASEPFPH
jgi:EmrB/QacA subfamily drug resistance transporter